MKNTKKFITVLMTTVLLFNFFTFNIFPTYAHDAMLDVIYDVCIESIGDGIDELWYVVNGVYASKHYDHETDTIKYYFEPSAAEGYTWTTDVSENVANEIKTAYANSMKKWNNVYFYSYDTSGNIVKNKIINIIEGTATDHNLSIYPKSGREYIALTDSIGNENIIESGTITHKHYNEWEMHVSVEGFYVHDSISADMVNTIRERTGAHEMGHVLGLYDIENYCNSNTSTDHHHHELLMGYGRPLESRGQNITYKDIAGVAITRGFHTDADHKWLNCGLQNNNKYKLLCSICNGVKEVSSLEGYTYDTYLSCSSNHNLIDGNMMAVASYGNQDYYKCKYCKYVAPFSDLVTQNYSANTRLSSQYHTYTNNVPGLNYTVIEKHSYTYTWISYTAHEYDCECGEHDSGSHVVREGAFSNGNQYAMCLLCKRKATFGMVEGNFSVTPFPHTANGSFILPNGVIVLVDEDMEAYFNGTLVFYEGDIPEIE